MTVSTRQADPLAALAQLTGVAALTALAIAGVSYFPIRSQFGESPALAVMAGISVSLLGSWLSAIPTVMTMNRAPVVFASGALAGLGVRFVVTIGLALIIRATGVLANDPFMISVGASQLLFLTVDVLVVIWLAQRVFGGRA